ncbi:MAG: hypothetical protein IJI78_05285 [Oscillospiraceae bacterium]|nr:hypothetical protein [Oscillospiraceae bacterium]
MAEHFSSAKRLFALMPTLQRLIFKRVKVIDPCRSGLYVRKEDVHEQAEYDLRYKRNVRRISLMR